MVPRLTLMVDTLWLTPKCGTAEIGRPERSELKTLSAVATTVLLAIFILDFQPRKEVIKICNKISILSTWFHVKLITGLLSSAQIAGESHLSTCQSVH